MPLIETLPVGEDTAQWQVWGTTARVVLTEAAHVPDATEIVRTELAAIDAACSRFRPDSELGRVCRSGGRPVAVSPLLAELVGAALEAARRTAGDVDPTVGAILAGLGYDRDFEQITGRPTAPAVRVFPSPDWRAVRLRGSEVVQQSGVAASDGALRYHCELTVPDGVLLDLGATAKALAADRAAARVAARLGTGVLVALGGDIATAGPAPEGGWRVLVQDRPGDPSCLIRLPGGAALATSSTASRRWGSGDRLHHIVDPRTGRPARPVWRTVSVAAYSCLDANTLSTAAIVRGLGALALLGRVPARLVTPGREVVRTKRWPA